MKITIFGAGYVGLVTGACLAAVGHQVLSVDVDSEKIDKLKRGLIPIYEPGLADVVKKCLSRGTLKFSDSPEEGVSFGAVLFIAVGTPPDEDGSADLQYVLSVAETVGKHMNEHRFIVNKSTVPVGTADKVRECIDSNLKRRGLKINFDVVSNPEFLKEGAAIDDFNQPDRVVIGVDNTFAELAMREVYAPFNLAHDQMIVMDVRSAELTKYASNAMLATRISFMNEMANLAELLGADVDCVRRGVGSDARIGHQFLYAGCGYGGSCFPKDVKALIKCAAAYDNDLKVLNAVEDANNLQKHILIKKVKSYFGNDLSGRHFALWGLAFKPNTDDMREAPSIELISGLLDSGATITAFDPVAMDEARRLYSQESRLTMAECQYSALDEIQPADALLIVTEWKEFHSPNFELIQAKLKTPVLFDGRNLYEPTMLSNAGFSYFAIGRGCK